MQRNQILLQQSQQAGRQYNQDRFAVHMDDDSGDIFVVVADGVGGSDNGEIAAQIVVEQSASYWHRRQDFADATSLLTEFVTQCNKAVKLSCEQGTKTATTVVALLYFKQQLVSAHAGDSRLYQFSQSGKVGQTKDHSLAYAKFMLGEITQQQLATHPSQSQLLNCVNGDAELQIDINHWQAAEGGYFVLCTDGFWEVFPDEAIADLIASDKRDTLFSSRLQAQVQQHPKHDNTTVVICHIAAATAAEILPEHSASAPQQTGARPQLLTAVDKPLPGQSAKKPQRQVRTGIVLVVLLSLLLVGYAGYRHYTKTCCVQSGPPELTQVQSTNASVAPQQSIAPTSDDTTEHNAAVDAQTPAPEAGSLPQLNDNLHSQHELELELAQNQDALAALLDKLLQQGDVAIGSTLQKTEVKTDQYAEITKVQLMVNNVPVYGAVLIYRKTADGIKVIGGKTANLPQLPAAPSQDFASCFSRYQQAQADANPVAVLNNAEITLYIDAASQSYFWLAPIAVGEAAVPHDLHLSDASCQALRLIARQVSG
mgnify:CR=1 FL=1